MKSQEAGFTMIELIIVIIILGVLASTALPKFIDMRNDAERAALDGLAGAASSAMNINYSGCSAKNNVPDPSNCVTINTCSNAQLLSIMQAPFDTNKYTVWPAGPDIGSTNGGTATCTITRTISASNVLNATFTGISAGN